MNRRIHILFAFTVILTSCANKIQPDHHAETQHHGVEWLPHSKDPVPNIFHQKIDKTPISHGFYVQYGSQPSNSTFESVAHYTYLAYRNINIGIEQSPYSISPSGRFVIIPETYYHGAKKYRLKIYDKRQNRYVLREVDAKTIRGYEWADDEQFVTVLFENSESVNTLSIPKT